MNEMQLTFVADELLRVGLHSNGVQIGLEFSTPAEAPPKAAVLLPVEEVAVMVAKLTSGLAAATRAAGGSHAMRAFRAHSVMVTRPPPGQAQGLLVQLADETLDAVVPVHLTREAAQALFSSLADILAS